MTPPRLITIVVGSLVLFSGATKSYAAKKFTDADSRDVRALFLRQAAAESAHDLAGIDGVLAPQEKGQVDPVTFVARAYRFWGREEVMDHFRTTFAGTWKFEPDERSIRIVPLGTDVAHIFAPTRITIGAAGQPGKEYQFLVNEFAVRTPKGWKITTIVPVPTQ